MIKIGCCGFPSGMKKYFERFKLVEVQKTFYAPPKKETAEKWRSQAPEDFEFTLKAWQLITHEPRSPTYKKAGIKIEKDREKNYGFFRDTEEVFEAWEVTRSIAKALKSRIVVFQCPSSFKENDENIENMRNFFNSIERDFVFAWEPRGNWSLETIAKVCKELDLIHCIDPIVSELAIKAKLAYFRLHGRGKKKYYYDYTKDDFVILFKKIEESEAEEIYCLFNNVYMEKNALEFAELIQAQ